MNILLKMFLSMSFSGSLFILLLLAGKRFLKDKISRQWQYYIWLIVVVRLLLPFGPETNLMGKAYQTIDQAITHSVSLPQQQSPSGDTNAFNVPASGMEHDNQNTVNPKDDSISSRPVGDILSLFSNHVWLIWLMVALILLVQKITAYHSFIRYVKAGLNPVSNVEQLDRLSVIAEQTGRKRPVELCVNPLVSSPLLIGFFRPCIVLPSADIPEKDFQYIVLHELTHYKRRDMFYKWLVQITTCLHWFNPLVYIMGHEISRECELSCDEEMIRTLNEKERRKYGDTLLHAMALGGKYKDTVSSVTLNESKELLKERLGAIINFKENSKAAKTIMLGLTFLLIVCSIIIGAYTIKNKPMQYSSDNSIQNFANDNRSDNLVKVSSDDLSGISENLNLSLDIENGGIVILPSTSNELQAVYDSEYYDVQLTDQNGEWIVTVSGKAERMGDVDEVQLYLPDIKTKMNVNVSNGDFSYNLPEDCQNEVDITAANGGVYFASSNHYANSDISLVAQERTFIVYEEPVYPNYFTRTDTGFSYKNGTELNKISISLIGYTSVEFQEL